MKHFLKISLFVFCLLSIVAPMHAQTTTTQQAIEQLKVPTTTPGIVANPEVVTKKSLNEAGEEIISTKSTKTTKTIGEDPVNIFEGIGLLQQFLNAWKQPINTVADFNGFLMIQLGLIMYLLTVLGRKIPFFQKIDETKAYFIGVVFTVGIAFTLLKGEFTVGMLVQWAGSGQFISMVYTFVTAFFKGLKTNAIGGVNPVTT